MVTVKKNFDGPLPVRKGGEADIFFRSTLAVVFKETWKSKSKDKRVYMIRDYFPCCRQLVDRISGRKVNLEEIDQYMYIFS